MAELEDAHRFQRAHDARRRLPIALADSVPLRHQYREGIVLSTVQYFDRDEKRYRPIFYRTSFAEM